MKRTIFLTAFLFSIMSMFAQIDSIKDFQPQPVQPPIENQIFLYPGEFVRDTISAVEFTYIKGRTLMYGEGQLVNVSQLWTTEPGGRGKVVIKKSYEFYVISDVSMRYEVKNKMVGTILCNSRTQEPTGILKFLKRKPEYVWDIRLK